MDVSYTSSVLNLKSVSVPNSRAKGLAPSDASDLRTDFRPPDQADLGLLAEIKIWQQKVPPGCNLKELF